MSSAAALLTRPSSAFHPGELAAQRAAGTSAAAAELSSGLATDLSAYPFARALLSSLVHVWLTSFGPSSEPDPSSHSERPAPRGALWNTPLFGPPGFVSVAPDATALVLRPALRRGEQTPLALALAPGDPVGLLAIDFATRRRFRANGYVHAVHEATGSGAQYVLTIRVREAFPNCPKYIFRRTATPPVLDADGRDTAPQAPPVTPSADVTSAPVDAGAQTPSFDAHTALSDADMALVRATDTFMLGTAAVDPGPGADASHRGGRPGFVRVLGPRALL